ncbi:nucleosome assembly protein [Xylaria nigripes]|nr:nucleosome assembly protein [Xylaria nigripes]
MGDSVEEINASYEGLAELEREFEDAETEIIRQQCALTKPLYEKREKLIAKISDFWPLVLEQAPPDIDQYIQPTDSAMLASSLTSISVSRFEIENGGKGDPRSISVKLEFSENEYLEDAVLEKKFWFRRSQDGHAGLVSEPVPIKWRAGKDLTKGMLDLAVKVWTQDEKTRKANGGAKSKKTTKPKDYTADQKALREKIDRFGLGGVSFFCWFGYRGLHISAEESAIAVEEDKKRRAEGKTLEAEDAAEDEDDEDDDEDPLALEIFPDGDDLAVAFSEDLWPSAIKYFIQAQEASAMSDIDFEDDEEGGDGIEEEEGDDDEDDDDDDEAPPLKRVKV